MYVDFSLHPCESVHCVLQNDRERGVTWSYIRYVTIHREGWIQYLKSPKARPGETQWPPSWLFYTAKLLRWRWHRWDAGLNSCHSDQNQVQVAILDSDGQCKNMQKHLPNHLCETSKIQTSIRSIEAKFSSIHPWSMNQAPFCQTTRLRQKMHEIHGCLHNLLAINLQSHTIC